ncbi:MAG: electron transfer flavoprotein subunit beta/FixA family protein [Desulforhopalus sp.]
MKIVVCVKAVPDPKEADKIKIDPETKTLMRGDVPFVVNPLDKHAVEAALELKRKYGATITIISMGPPAAGNSVKECLALGADHGILLSDRSFGGADAYATALTLAKGIEKNGEFDLVLCGMASSDGATEWVGPQIATFLGIPVVTMVNEIQAESGDEWLVKTAWEDGYRKVGVRLPAVLTVARELNMPKNLSFSGIIKARKKEITTWSIEDLDVSPDAVGFKGSPTIVGDFGTLETGRNVEFLEGTAEEKAERLVGILTESGAIG